MNCHSCDYRNPSTAKVCGRCGQHLKNLKSYKPQALQQPKRQESSLRGNGWTPGISDNPNSALSQNSEFRSRTFHKDQRNSNNEISVYEETLAKGITGEVTSLHRHDRSGTSTWPYTYTWHESTWTFRVTHYDSIGRQLPPIPVEMQGEEIRGVLSEGDIVQIKGKWKPGTTLYQAKLYNLTTNSTVEANSGAGCAEVFRIIIIVVGVIFVIYLWISFMSGF